MGSLQRLVTIASRFAWRLSRNLLCLTPLGRSWLFPPAALAARFGREDAGYAIKVFLHHYRQLHAAGFSSARRLLEIGPGRNQGTALLWWAYCQARTAEPVTVTLWDVYPNMLVNSQTLQTTATALLDHPDSAVIRQNSSAAGLFETLKAVAAGTLAPSFDYRIEPLTALASQPGGGYDLVYSQAAIEHIWAVADFWRTVIGLTPPGGWHSHRIDLADHGRRDTHYIEMLEWSPLAYWLTMRFIPGAINRWRAGEHLDFIARQCLQVVSAERITRDALPVPRNHLHAAYQSLDELELRTIALDVVALKPPASGV